MISSISYHSSSWVLPNSSSYSSICLKTEEAVFWCDSSKLVKCISFISRFSLSGFWYYSEAKLAIPSLNTKTLRGSTPYMRAKILTSNLSPSIRYGLLIYFCTTYWVLCSRSIFLMPLVKKVSNPLVGGIGFQINALPLSNFCFGLNWSLNSLVSEGRIQVFGKNWNS